MWGHAITATNLVITMANARRIVAVVIAALQTMNQKIALCMCRKTSQNTSVQIVKKREKNIQVTPVTGQKCPTYLELQKKLMKSIPYYSKNEK